jgi:hypothetical protein
MIFATSGTAAARTTVTNMTKATIQTAIATGPNAPIPASLHIGPRPENAIPAAFLNLYLQLELYDQSYRI